MSASNLPSNLPTIDSFGLREINSREVLKGNRHTQNLVYVMTIEPCKYNGDSFNQQQLNLIQSITACNALHNTIKIGSSSDAAEFLSKLGKKSDLIQFGRLVVFALECPAQAAEYYEYMLLSFATRRNPNNILELMANRFGEWVECIPDCNFGIVVNKLFDLHYKLNGGTRGGTVPQHPLSGAYNFRLWG
jgi:hypothetical protein